MAKNLRERPNKVLTNGEFVGGRKFVLLVSCISIIVILFVSSLIMMIRDVIVISTPGIRMCSYCYVLLRVLQLF